MKGFNSPCAECPFTRDGLKLRKARRKEIAKALKSSDPNVAPFPCHKTFKRDDNGYCIITNQTSLCRGGLICLDRSGGMFQNVVIRLLARAKDFDPNQLNLDCDRVFDSLDDFIDNGDL